MALTHEELEQRIASIREWSDPYSRKFGQLLNWTDGLAWHYGIGLSETHIFDTGRGLCAFHSDVDAKEVMGIEEIWFGPERTIERLVHALRVFREWDYEWLGWNGEHLARLVATDDPISFEANPEARHPTAQADLERRLREQAPELLGRTPSPSRVTASESEFLAKAKQEIRNWEQEGPSWISQVGSFILWPATKLAEKLIPDGVQERVGKAIESFLLGISNLADRTIDPAGIQQRVKARLADAGENPSLWQQLAAADEEAQSCWNWNLGFAAAEGGATGAAGLFGLAADIPALFTLVSRLIQQMGVCYGYDPTRPEERDYVLHILRTASASDVNAKLEALAFLKQLEQILIKVSWKKMTAELAAKQISQLSLLAAMRQFARTLGINLTRRKALQMVPVIGAVVGASFNATYANDVGRTAFMSYRRRWLAEREKPEGGPS